MSTKVCKQCNIEKSLSEFNKISNRDNLYRTICKECYKERYKESSQKYRKKYREENGERMNELSKQWGQENKEQHAANSKKYKEKNRQRVRDKDAKWFQDNKERIYDKVSERRKNDPIFKSYMDLRNMLWRCINKKHKPTYDLLGYTTDDFFSKFRKDIEYFRTNEIKYHIDHKIPIDWFNIDSPPNVICHLDNLQISSAKRNLAKNNYFADSVAEDYKILALPFIKNEYKLMIV